MHCSFTNIMLFIWVYSVCHAKMNFQRWICHACLHFGFLKHFLAQPSGPQLPECSQKWNQGWLSNSDMLTHIWTPGPHRVLFSPLRINRIISTDWGSGTENCPWQPTVSFRHLSLGYFKLQQVGMEVVRGKVLIVWTSESCEAWGQLLPVQSWLVAQARTGGKWTQGRWQTSEVP